MPRVKFWKFKMHRFTTKAKKRRVLLVKYFLFPSSFPLSCLFFFGCLRWNKKFAHIKLKSSSSSKLPRSFASLFSRKKSQTLASKITTQIGSTLYKKPSSHSFTNLFLHLLHKPSSTLTSTSSSTIFFPITTHLTMRPPKKTYPSLSSRLGTTVLKSHSSFFAISTLMY